ncbi:hypothetical protein [Tsukamurella spumae]|uniref:Uncharacterized protein n=1 Tax=Tsukamurella spumae TaxID=44753 RepID=A0A846X480_9ACTN|nr:hypothetical protein [Tsukamurella spumae]NKY19953.1 hypothetical protein [Tsukamurella spumae]
MKRLQLGGDGGTVRRRGDRIEIRLGHDHWLMNDQEARALADRIHDAIEKGTR